MSKKKVNITRPRGRPYNKPNEEYGSPEELLKWSKESTNKREREKFLAIRMLMLEGERIGFKGVSNLIGITVRALNKWVRKWNNEGKEGLKRKSGSGRPRKFLKEHDEAVTDLIKNQTKEKKRLTIKGVYNFLKEPV
jgi:transposase